MLTRKEVRLFIILVSFNLTFGQTYCPITATAINPCHCTPTEVECEAKQLTEVPKFINSGNNYLFERLKLGGNLITNIPQNAFANINVSQIWLNDNNIDTLDPEAFVHVADDLHYVDLSNNNLTETPEALMKLSNLTTLYLSGNPIPASGFTTKVMRSIGDYIHDFSFGHPSLAEWPSTTHHLQGMKKLTFSGGSMHQINRTSFHGFEWMLQELWIENTQLIAVPIALQDLKSVREFHFNDNVRVMDAGILIPAFAGFTKSLETLSLENNGLTTIPSVLLTLSNLHDLSLARNRLEFISDEAITNVVSNLTTLNLKQCGLDRIPGALSKLPNLLHLDFSNNAITTIEKNDLQDLRLLQTVDVSNNSLLYVSKSTFHDLDSIQEMYFKDTLIYLIPEALKNVPSLKVFNVERADPYIECNCDLSWLYCHMLKPTPKPLHITGKCYTIEMDIEKYVREKIPDTCPIPC